MNASLYFVGRIGLLLDLHILDGMSLCRVCIRVWPRRRDLQDLALLFEFTREWRRFFNETLRADVSADLA